MSRVHYVMSIPQQNLSRFEGERARVRSLCELSANELLLACGVGGLRALSLHTGQLAAHEPTALRDVWRVAFDAHTNTLLLLLEVAAYLQLVSLRRNASEWLEVQRFNTIISDHFKSSDMAVCDSRVLLLLRKKLYVFDINAAHTLRDAGSVSLHCELQARVHSPRRRHARRIRTR